MKSYKIVDMNLEPDKAQIAKWETDYADTQEYKNIEHFILEDKLLYNLDEVIEMNYEAIHIGKNEIKKALVAKTKDDEILGFLLCQAFDLQTTMPELFLQYVVISPKYQHQGYGRSIFTEFFSNPNKYLGLSKNIKTPHYVFSYIDKTNAGSLALYKSFGFTFAEQKNSRFVRATGIMPEIEKAINQSSFE